MSVGTILIVVLVLILLGALPVYPYSRSWGPWPGGAVAVVLLVLLLLVFAGRL